jgi:hypothetical protein
VHTALSKDRAQRFANAVDMRNALRELVSEGGMTLNPEASIPPLADKTRAPANGPVPGSTMPPTMPPSSLRTATWTGTGVPRPVSAVEKPFELASLKKPLLALAVAAVLGAIGFVARDRLERRAAMTQFFEHVASGSFTVAENVFNEYFEDFTQKPEAIAAIPDVLRKRREAERMEEQLGVAFDPAYQLLPSTWVGTYTEKDRPQRIIVGFESVDGATFTGYIDWPDDGIRAAIRGIRDGNHLVFWDHAVITGVGPAAERYRLDEKKNVLVTGDRFTGFDGPYQAKLEATLQSR